MEIHALKRPVLSAGILLLSLPILAAVPDGYVVKVDSSAVYLDWGKVSGVQEGDTFSVYRPGAELKHPVTGEILGKEAQILGQGMIERIEEKYSSGKLIEQKEEIKPGDRTRLEIPVVSTPPAPAAGAVEGIASSPAPKERWRSEPLAEDARGFAIGDVDGDGQKEVVVAFRSRIEMFRWNGKNLESKAIFKGRGYGNWLAVEVSSGPAGRDRIFATHFTEGTRSARVAILEWRDGLLKETGHLDGFVRAVNRMGGEKSLLWQGLSMAREYRTQAPETLELTAKGWRPNGRLKLVRSLNDDQLFGFTFGDWDGDKAEDLALLQSGERLRIFFKDAKWSAPDIYGGTRADFSLGSDTIGTLYPRLRSWKPAEGKELLLAPHNIPQLGIRLTYLKLYKKAEIVALAWNGLEMAPVWKVPLAGYLADYALGDGLRDGTTQLWVATVGAGDKTVLIGYTLP
jgi:hypothetical protein